MKRYKYSLWGIPRLEDLNKESNSEGQKKAKTSGERRPMASAAMLAHFKILKLTL
jgi:hypothetical protein